MRQIALGTETTGLSTDAGHRIIEIGAIEMVDRKITGHNFHYYINPQRKIDSGAFAVHGISDESLRDKPKFHEILGLLLNYIRGAELIIHNAPFDVGFLNHEFSLATHAKSVHEHCTVFDTLAYARQKHPGQKNSLDALCKRYKVDNSHRNLHGALLDADLLARIYLAMTGGQGSLFSESDAIHGTKEQEEMRGLLTRTKPLPVAKLSEEEQQAHLEFLAVIKKTSGLCVWEEDL